MPEFFPGVHIADMNLDHWCFNGRDSITDGYRSMRIAAGVKQDAIMGKAGLVKIVDDLPFHIVLEIAEFHCRKGFLQLLEIILERLVAVDAWFPLAQQVEIRPVDDGYLHDVDESKLMNDEDN